MLVSISLWGMLDNEDMVKLGMKQLHLTFQCIPKLAQRPLQPRTHAASTPADENQSRLTDLVRHTIKISKQGKIYPEWFMAMPALPEGLARIQRGSNSHCSFFFLNSASMNTFYKEVFHCSAEMNLDILLKHVISLNLAI